MKVQISQKYIYHKVATVEIEIDKDEYKKYLSDNKGYHFLDDYLLDHEELWVEKIDNAINKAELLFVDESEEELRYDCEELKTGGHL